uniref:Uncharacterized protein n=1 Tax=viral metagenome TaxID=1070528 RepID=A0A6M3JNG0_9ZZZZ
MNYLIFTFAMLGLIFCMSDSCMPWSNLIGIFFLVICFLILKLKED